MIMPLTTATRAWAHSSWYTATDTFVTLTYSGTKRAPLSRLFPLISLILSRLFPLLHMKYQRLMECACTLSPMRNVGLVGGSLLTPRELFSPLARCTAFCGSVWNTYFY